MRIVTPALLGSLALFSYARPAEAKKAAAVMHCVGSDGSEVAAKDKKACKKAKGKWEKAPATPPPAAEGSPSATPPSSAPPPP